MTDRYCVMCGKDGPVCCDRQPDAEAEIAALKRWLLALSPHAVLTFGAEDYGVEWNDGKAEPIGSSLLKRQAAEIERLRSDYERQLAEMATKLDAHYASTQAELARLRGALRWLQGSHDPECDECGEHGGRMPMRNAQELVGRWGDPPQCSCGAIHFGLSCPYGGDYVFAPEEARVGHDPAPVSDSRQESGTVGAPDRVQHAEIGWVATRLCGQAGCGFCRMNPSEPCKGQQRIEQALLEAFEQGRKVRR